MDIQEITPVLEAVLFTAGDSVEIRRIAKVIGAEPWEVREAAEKLAKSYEDRGSGLRLLRLEERLQLVTAPAYSDIINRVLEKRPVPKLSPTALEVLSIVAYYQPVTRAYIEQLRGTDSSYTVAVLSERVMGISSLAELPPLPNIAAGEGLEELQAAIDAASGKNEQLSMNEVM